MKTTVELPDALVIEAKKLAAERRIPLRVLIENGLRSELERPLNKGKQDKSAIDWVSSPGGAPDLDDRESMHNWLASR